MDKLLLKTLAKDGLRDSKIMKVMSRKKREPQKVRRLGIITKQLYTSDILRNDKNIKCKLLHAWLIKFGLK